MPSASGGRGAGTGLLSRVVVTWVELTLVWVVGAVLVSVTSGPPVLVVSLATTLVSVGVLLYNVDALVTDRLTAAGEEGEADGPGSDGPAVDGTGSDGSAVDGPGSDGSAVDGSDPPG